MRRKPAANGHAPARARMPSQYLVVGVTLVVGAAALILQAARLQPVPLLLVSGYVLVIALLRGWDMVRDFARRRGGVDVLAVAAIFSTVAVGEYWASLVIVLMLSGGGALEEYAQRHAKAELTSLLARSPQVAHRIDGGTTADVPAEDVEAGNVLLVKPGEMVPVDGVLLSPVATLDESSITGESLPVEHALGDALFSGSVNGEHAVTVRATSTAADSLYQQIIELVRAASESRAPFVRLADRVALPFTLAAFALAGVAWLLSGTPTRFAEVLVVATPCPLLLAAPVAFIAGMSRAARNGIIIRNGSALEMLGRVRTAAFDKTGTLTHGRPVLSDIRCAPDRTPAEVLSLAATAEQYSLHVAAQAIVRAAEQQHCSPEPATNVREVTSQGVVAHRNGTRIVAGRRTFVEQEGGPFDADGPGGGEMAVYLAADGRYAGTLVLRDAARAEARATLDALRSLGVARFLMLTGDGTAAAQQVASELGIDEVRAECLPKDKVDAVSSAQPRPVMMVGDGVNDAPVLAAADIGVAMGAKGATAASESADVVVLVDDLARTATAVSIGKDTMRTAMQSIWLGMGLSALLMVIAAFGYLPAILGAGFQEVVDLLTILNALRALRDRPLPGRAAASVTKAPSPAGPADGTLGRTRAGRT
ncbi:heavy metal translocating P-type ATPase [Paenarthrobacter sp. DKR-5]|uniref:heavy metal translocating P-type ATPase n=1 Tax=Paenarthrobacter sp. DKR-5 TaxID=2835535 RepID=UPI001BDC32C5|nr:heavy metal translocating P-type ATPase [Paenarthrobacter sp. DKR-5]MBT1001612.1 heavy metal translocating P-type ATPase [Paenarthrobacter sp. DKR-5]